MAKPQKNVKKKVFKRIRQRPTSRNTQAVGAVPAKPGLSVALARNTRMKVHSVNNAMRWMDANDPMHLALPRAIGPYSVTRSTDMIPSNSGLMVFGTFMQKSTGYWTNISAIGSVSGGDPINNTVNTRVFATPGIDRKTLGYGSQLVPSAITVQIMNPEALNTTTGTVYAGVMNQVPQLGNDALSWADFARNFVSYNKPRLVAAGKLCLSGVKASGIPMNMSALSHFTPIQGYENGNFTWNMVPPTGTLVNELDADFCGFAPIVVYNPNELKLQYLVTTEYRLRFDISNPASSTHSHHRPGSVDTWSGVVKTMCSLGDGVRDIADVVASTGRAAGAASEALVTVGMLGG